MKTCIEAAARDSAFAGSLGKLLLEICQVNTAIRPEVDQLKAAESQVFDVLERELRACDLPGLKLERRAINPKIADHRFYSQTYYTKTTKNPDGLGVEQTYAGRSNLIATIEGENRSDKGVGQALNGHIDVVAPYIPPQVKDGVLYGRGACDDKGAVVALVGALKLVGGYLRSTNKRLNKNVIGMFVIEEEMGGNGSLSLAIDRDLRKLYDSIMVLECCSGKIHPGNRGALWYKIVLHGTDSAANLFEASAYIIEELEREGRSIKAESRHELFPHRPVQTCHGMIGPFGEHPSRINGRIDFTIRFPGGRPEAARVLIQDLLDSALAEYMGQYGDKTKVPGVDGKPKVARHYDHVESSGGFAVQVHGSTGHMGSILENDGAITKAATMVRSLLRSREALTKMAGGPLTLELLNQDRSADLVMEGGQGFLPTHPMDEIMHRLTVAAQRGLEAYSRQAGHRTPKVSVEVSFQKLHNAAFAGRADSPDMQNAIAAARGAGIWRDEPVRGWDVSCDARLFATEYPEMPVLTSGPGALACAHADNEHVKIADIAQFAEFLAHYILLQTGTL